MQTNSKKDNCIYLSGAVKEANGFIWMSLLEANGLVQIDINTGVARFVECFKNEIQEYQLHTQIVLYKNKMFFIPWNGINIAIYEFEKNELRYVIGNNRNPGRFVSGMQDGRYLYLVSETFHTIVKFDMDEEKIIDVYELKEINQEDEFLGHVMPLKIGTYLWKITGSSQGSWKFDLHNNQYLLQENLFEKKVRLVAGCTEGEFFWLLDDNDILYQLSENGTYINQYDLSIAMDYILKEEKRESLNCIFLNNILYVISYGKGCIIKIPFSGDEFLVHESQYQKFENLLVYVEDRILTIESNSKLVFINEVEKKEITFHVSPDFYDTYIMKKEGILQENKFYNMGLESYIECLCKKKDNLLSDQESCDMSIGKSIIDICWRV